MNQLEQSTIAAFRKRFEHEPTHVFLAPGRINIIGEHIDYNDGFVLPAAIDRFVCVAIEKSSGKKCHVIAMDIHEEIEFDIEQELRPVRQMWANYFLGVIHEMKQRGFKPGGFNAVFSSTVPVGAGLSSSAAVECAFGLAINSVFSLGIGKKDLALIGQKSEHTFVGVMCGIMDQFASVFGKEGHVIKLDCISLNYEYHKADFQSYSLLLLNSNVEHKLSDSNYNNRRNEVEKGLSTIKAEFPEVVSFRDCTENHIYACKEELGETLFKRCHFVVKEIKRVGQAVKALDNADFSLLGKLMFETHDGLSKEYEVSCRETDFLVDAVRNNPRVLGARMMGGGFGGCTINLVERDYEDELIADLTMKYKEKFNIELLPYQVKIADGAHQSDYDSIRQ